MAHFKHDIITHIMHKRGSFQAHCRSAQVEVRTGQNRRRWRVASSALARSAKSVLAFGEVENLPPHLLQKQRHNEELKQSGVIMNS